MMFVSSDAEVRLGCCCAVVSWVLANVRTGEMMDGTSALIPSLCLQRRFRRESIVVLSFAPSHWPDYQANDPISMLYSSTTAKLALELMKNNRYLACRAAGPLESFMHPPNVVLVNTMLSIAPPSVIMGRSRGCGWTLTCQCSCKDKGFDLGGSDYGTQKRLHGSSGPWIREAADGKADPDRLESCCCDTQAVPLGRSVRCAAWCCSAVYFFVLKVLLILRHRMCGMLAVCHRLELSYQARPMQLRIDRRKLCCWLRWLRDFRTGHQWKSVRNRMAQRATVVRFQHFDFNTGKHPQLTMSGLPRRRGHLQPL